ncbi:MAG: methyltransferase domain-containing protein [Kiloniellales bacterium]|nr:methyltransferase domain-containing protein [Kiloniellales bacterium]
MTKRGQRWDPERYRRNAGFVAELGAPLLDLLTPEPGDKVLDLGCGDGALTEKLAARGAVVVGVDASAEQVAAARARGLDARVADGEALAFEAEFDAVLSNAALHWMTRPDAVIDGVWRALKPGGRFVGEMGGAGNVERVKGALTAALARRGLDPAAADPWYFPTPDDYAGRLATRGFRVEEIALIDRPTPLPGRLGDWLETFAEPFLFLVAESERSNLVAEVEGVLADTLRQGDGGWFVDYVRLRFRAVKPAVRTGR